jgi:hypothetical protein
LAYDVGYSYEKELTEKEKVMLFAKPRLRDLHSFFFFFVITVLRLRTEATMGLLNWLSRNPGAIAHYPGQLPRYQTLDSLSHFGDLLSLNLTFGPHNRTKRYTVQPVGSPGRLAPKPKRLPITPYSRYQTIGISHNSLPERHSGLTTIPFPAPSRICISRSALRT